jgi:hypothetical protein
MKGKSDHNGIGQHENPALRRIFLCERFACEKQNFVNINTKTPAGTPFTSTAKEANFMKCV